CPLAIAEPLAIVKVGNSECEFLKWTPLSRSAAIAGAVCGVTILPRRPSGIKRIKLRGVAFCAAANPAVVSVIRLADNSVMARRISFSPFAGLRRRLRHRLVLRRDTIVTRGERRSRAAETHSRDLILPGVCRFVVPMLEEGAGKAGRRLRPHRRVLNVG